MLLNAGRAGAHPVSLPDESCCPHVQVGGRCQSVELQAPVRAQVAAQAGTFRFDTGPSLLLFPNTYKSTYAALGQDMEDHVPLRRVEPAAYRVHFEKGGYLDMLYDQQQMVAQLEAVEPGAGRCACGTL